MGGPSPWVAGLGVVNHCACMVASATNIRTKHEQHEQSMNSMNIRTKHEQHVYHQWVVLMVRGPNTCATTST
jgi:hypothetical protein